MKSYTRGRLAGIMLVCAGSALALLVLAFSAGCDQTGAFGTETLTKDQIEARVASATARDRAEAAKDAAESKRIVDEATRRAASKVKRAELNTQGVAIEAADELAAEVGAATARLDAANADREAAAVKLNAMRDAAYAEIDRKNAALNAAFSFAKPFAAAVPGASEGLGLLGTLLGVGGVGAVGVAGVQTVRVGRKAADLKSLINGIDKLRHTDPAMKSAMKTHKDKFEGQLTPGAKRAIVDEAL